MNNLRSLYYRFPVLNKILRIIPTSVLLGYRTMHQERSKLNQFLNLSLEAKELFLLDQVNEVLARAKEYRFYRDWYAKHGIHDFHVKSLEELSKYPVLTKEVMREYGYINEVLATEQNKYWANTGGSSGTPFRFALPNNIYPKLWVYKESIWGELGYRLGDPVLSFRGHSMPKLYTHQTVYNFYYVNSNILDTSGFDVLVSLIRSKGIRYLHGYPTNILSFAELVASSKMQISIKGIFTASEYISMSAVRFLEDVFGCGVISSYEQSETSLLAYRNSNDGSRYKFNSVYGLPQVENIDGSKVLIGTGLLNNVMPLIRYNTGDTVEDFDGVTINPSVGAIGGRIGEFIEIGKRKISVTGLIHGNHLPLFDVCRSIQLFYSNDQLYVFYSSRGEVDEIILASTRRLLSRSLNSAHVRISFHEVDRVIRTERGKGKILLSQRDFTRIMLNE